MHVCPANISSDDAGYEYLWRRARLTPSLFDFSLEWRYDVTASSLPPRKSEAFSLQGLTRVLIVDESMALIVDEINDDQTV